MWYSYDEVKDKAEYGILNGMVIQFIPERLVPDDDTIPVGWQKYDLSKNLDERLEIVNYAKDNFFGTLLCRENLVLGTVIGDKDVFYTLPENSNSEDAVKILEEFANSDPSVQLVLQAEDEDGNITEDITMDYNDLMALLTDEEEIDDTPVKEAP